MDWCNQDFKSLQLTPKFTKGQPDHPYHPKPYIHDRIDAMIRRQQEQPDRQQTIKVCVDCIDDTNFINHLIHAHCSGVKVECIVDWRKMTLTNSDNYVRLKRSGIELLGVFCTPKDPLIEVAPDMHNKFIIFGDEDAMIGSFNITFDRWWANWESGMTFRSRGVCRLFDNIFQSVRGGVIQRYGIDPLSHFNLLYTFGRHAAMNGKYYRPHHAIISEIHRARRSIKLVLFLIGELRGEHHESVIDALIHARTARRRREDHPERPSRPAGQSREGAPDGGGAQAAAVAGRDAVEGEQAFRSHWAMASTTSLSRIRRFIPSIASSTTIWSWKELSTGTTPPSFPTTSSSSPRTRRSPNRICSSSTRS